MEKTLLLTFDVEEFDLPLEYGIRISKEEQFEITDRGMKSLMHILEKNSIPATFFTTGSYALRNPDLIKSLSKEHEIASHAMTHSGFLINDYSESKRCLELITGQKVNGFRMPRFAKTDPWLIMEAGYKYDSSYNPTWIPGRYNNLDLPRKFHRHKQFEFTEIPVSVSPVMRLPLFWLSFKMLPLSVYQSLCKLTLEHDTYLNLYFHPWEFVDLRSYDIPKYIRNTSGDVFADRFQAFLSYLSAYGKFSTVSSFLAGACR
jgi:hypothetical protein